MKSLYDQHLNAITDTCRYSEAAAKACEKVTLEFAKGFGEWIPENYYQWYNAHEWMNRISGEKKTTEELIALYQEHISLTKSETKN